MSQKLEQKKREFAEEFGMLFSSMGMPPMGGRIWAWLLTSEPPGQTAAQIAGGLRASRGSVSTISHLLMQLGLVEQVPAPGQRSRVYRVTSGGFGQVLKSKLRLATELRRMAERGLQILRDGSAEARRRLEEYRDLCVFFEREFPAIIEAWEKQRKKRKR